MWSEALCAAGNLVGQVFEVKVAQSYLTFCDPHGLNSPWNSSGQNTGEGSLSLLQGIFPTRGLNPHSPLWGAFFPLSVSALSPSSDGVLL